MAMFSGPLRGGSRSSRQDWPESSLIEAIILFLGAGLLVRMLGAGDDFEVAFSLQAIVVDFPFEGG
jgi:hypothetical protein